MEANQQKPNKRLLTPPRPSALEGLKQQPRRAAPVDYDDSLPARYNRKLQALITAMNDDIKRDLMPAIKRLKSDYIADSQERVIWVDGWPSVMNALLSAFAEKWGNIGKLQSERLAAGTVRMIDAENSEQFVKSVNKAVGVEVFGTNSAAVTEALEAATIANAKLIKNITDTHAERISTIVMENMRAGFAPSKIAKDLQKQAGISRRRAKNIARDQVSKLNGELTEQRSTAAGLECFRWVDSGDGRVGADHERAATRDVGYGPGVYRWKNPPKEGKPGRATRPFCRCTAAPVFEWELPNYKR